MHHELKIHPLHFGKFLCGDKPFEIRRNDRDFREGDTVTFREWDPLTGDYTGNMSIRLQIVTVYRHDDMPQAIQPGWCVFSHAPIVNTFGIR